MTIDPVLIAYAIKRSAKNRRPVWTRVGAAYPHDQGAGLTVVLDVMPLDGRIILLERGDDDDERLQREAARRAAARSSSRADDGKRANPHLLSWPIPPVAHLGKAPNAELSNRPIAHLPSRVNDQLED